MNADAVEKVFRYMNYPPLPSPKVDHAAFELFKAAGRPDGLWESLSEYEREAWRHCVRVVCRAVGVL